MKEICVLSRFCISFTVLLTYMFCFIVHLPSSVLILRIVVRGNAFKMSVMGVSQPNCMRTLEQIAR